MHMQKLLKVICLQVSIWRIVPLGKSAAWLLMRSWLRSCGKNQKGS